MDLDEREIILSVCCVTYNHEKFITQCLEGFVSQKTNYCFEILVHDDASTDNTAEIVKKYERNYPNLFKCVYQVENQFLKQNVLTNILFKMAKGKFIALCEGDDFWIDPNKIQKQVDFLLANPSYSSCYHSAKVVNSDGDLISSGRRSNYKSFTDDELISGKGELMTLTVMFRNQIELIEDFEKVKNGDTAIWHMLGYIGHAKFIEDISPAAYRVHEKGSWNGVSEFDRLANGISTYKIILKNLHKTNKDTGFIYQRLADMLNKFMIKQIAERNIKSYFKGVVLLLSEESIKKNLLIKVHFKSIFSRFI